LVVEAKVVETYVAEEEAYVAEVEAYVAEVWRVATTAAAPSAASRVYSAD
jgi:hypothetical protein